MNKCLPQRPRSRRQWWWSQRCQQGTWGHRRRWRHCTPAGPELWRTDRLDGRQTYIWNRERETDVSTNTKSSHCTGSSGVSVPANGEHLGSDEKFSEFLQQQIKPGQLLRSGAHTSWKQQWKYQYKHECHNEKTVLRLLFSAPSKLIYSFCS